MPGRRASKSTRALALIAVLAFLAAGGLGVSLVARALDGGSDAPTADLAAPTRTATPTRTPKAKATPKPAPTPRPLTAAQRAERRAAAEQVRTQGFEPISLRSYRPGETLRVLIGEATDSTATGGSARGRRAFFFLEDTYLGTDSTESSSEVRVLRQTKNTVTLRYRLTSGSSLSVRFKYNGAALVPTPALPPAAERQG